MVCELLKANLYEFYKFNRESGGEIYFTMPRLQVVAFHFFSHFLLFSADFRSYKRLCTRARTHTHIPKKNAISFKSTLTLYIYIYVYVCKLFFAGICVNISSYSPLFIFSLP